MKHKFLKIIAIILGALVVGALIYLFTQRTQQQSIGSYKTSVAYPTTPVTLNLWLPVDEKGSLEPVIEQYNKIYPNVTVQIEYIDTGQYQTRLLQAQSANTLPDMFVFRGDGLPLYKNSLATAPKAVFTTQQFNDTFASFTTKQLISENAIYGAPLGLATLGLIYNTQRFLDAGINSAPTTWSEFEKTNDSLRKKTGADLFASGVALGTPAIRNYPDIISVLMMQNGALMTNQPPTQATFQQPETTGYPAAAKAVMYYASFAQPTRQNYSWSDTLGDSVGALAQNKTALIVDYPMAAKLVTIQNSNMQLGMAALPQVNSGNPINYGVFLTGGVSKSSQNSEIAWDFWGFVTTKPAQKLFSLQSFWPASRKDLSIEQQNDKDLAPFAKQSSTATDWYKGANFATNIELVDMLNQYLIGLDAQIVVNNAANKITAIIQQSLK